MIILITLTYAYLNGHLTIRILHQNPSSLHPFAKPRLAPEKTPRRCDARPSDALIKAHLVESACARVPRPREVG